MGGVDGHVFLDARRDWVLSGGVAGSSLHGTEGAIARVQVASQRYLQRPTPRTWDDPTRTSLSGRTGNINLNRNRGNVTVNAAMWGMSPGFESNDAGFMTQADRGGGHGQVLFRKLTPDRFTRTRQLVVAKWWTWNWGGDSQGDGVQAVTNLQFLNYWRYNLTLGWSKDTWDDRLTRGGPTTIRPGIMSVNTSVVSDTRKRFFLTLTGAVSERNFNGFSRTFSSAITYQPSDAVSVSMGPQVLRSQSQAQYLSRSSIPCRRRPTAPVCLRGSRADRMSMPTRLNITLSPRLGLQVYMQPLVSVGDYGASRSSRVHARTTSPNTDATWAPLRRCPAHRSSKSTRTPPAGRSFRISQPDFNIKSLRVNAVGRWEFRPGSTLFLVWTRFGNDRSNPGDFQFGRDVSDLWGAKPDDVFLVKVSYWIGLTGTSTKARRHEGAKDKRGRERHANRRSAQACRWSAWSCAPAFADDTPVTKVAATECAALGALRLPDVAISAAAAMAPAPDKGRVRFPHCKVTGVIGTEIRFEVLLPDTWNRRFAMGGGGGFVGSVQNQFVDVVNRGYAAAGTDTGHQARGCKRDGHSPTRSVRSTTGF